MADKSTIIFTGLSGTGRVPDTHVLDDSDDPLIARFLRAHGPVSYTVTAKDVTGYFRRRKALSGSLLVVLASIPVMLGLSLVGSIGLADGLLRSVLEHWGLQLFVLPNWVALLPGALALLMAVAMGVFVYFLLTIDGVSPESLARARVLKQVRRDAQRWERVQLHDGSPASEVRVSARAGSVIAAWLGGGVIGAVLGALWRDDLAAQAVSLFGPRALELVTSVASMAVFPAGLIACGVLALSPLPSRAKLVLCAVLGGVTFLVTALLIMVGTGDVAPVAPRLITA